MAEKIIVTSATGGAGRTTLALHLAVALGARGLRTLLVDLDPSNGVAHALGRGDRALRGVADVLALDAAPSQVMLETRSDNLWLLPRGRLDPTEARGYEALLSEPGRLASILGAAEQGFDRVVIDAPAGVGALARAGLAAADRAVLAVAADPLALRALSQALRVIESARAHENPRLSLLGIVLTRVDLRSARGQSAANALWDGFESVCEAVVPESEAIAEAAELGVPVGFIGARGAAAARRFEALADELEARRSSGQERTGDNDDGPRSFL
jgi:chromosome partitioning protein